MQAYLASQNQFVDLKLNVEKPSQPDHEMDSLIHQLDMSSLKFIQKEKVSPSSIARSCYGSPVVQDQRDFKAAQDLQNSVIIDVVTDTTQLEKDIMELQNMNSWSISSSHSSDVSLSPKSDMEIAFDHFISYDDTPLPPRTDLLTDSILYTNPELSQSKDYWQYEPPKARSSRAQSKYVAQVSDGSYHNIEDVVHQVQFKMGFRYFQCSEAGPYAFFPGDMVVVTGERGEDLGVVVDLLDMASYVARVRAGNHSLDEEEYKLRTIVRLASMAERALLPNKFHDEQMAGQYCSDAAKHMFRLHMQIVAAEFQFDRSKLFVYYTANSRVDFRELIKHVFSTFKTCIWFKKVNRNNVFEPRPFATVALRTGSF